MKPHSERLLLIFFIVTFGPRQKAPSIGTFSMLDAQWGRSSQKSHIFVRTYVGIKKFHNTKHTSLYLVSIMLWYRRGGINYTRGEKLLADFSQQRGGGSGGSSLAASWRWRRWQLGGVGGSATGDGGGGGGGSLATARRRWQRGGVAAAILCSITSFIWFYLFKCRANIILSS